MDKWKFGHKKDVGRVKWSNGSSDTQVSLFMILSELGFCYLQLKLINTFSFI